MLVHLPAFKPAIFLFVQRHCLLPSRILHPRQEPSRLSLPFLFRSVSTSKGFLALLHRIVSHLPRHLPHPALSFVSRHRSTPFSFQMNSNIYTQEKALERLLNFSLTPLKAARKATPKRTEWINFGKILSLCGVLVCTRTCASP